MLSLDLTWNLDWNLNQDYKLFTLIWFSNKINEERLMLGGWYNR